MTDEDDEEVEMVMNRKSRFSRYRMRVREKKNLDINEIMIIDDPNNTSCALFYSFTFFVCYFKSLELMKYQILNNKTSDLLVKYQQQNMTYTLNFQIQF
jgi:hypothetical protein